MVEQQNKTQRDELRRLTLCYAIVLDFGRILVGKSSKSDTNKIGPDFGRIQNKNNPKYSRVLESPGQGISLRRRYRILRHFVKRQGCHFVSMVVIRLKVQIERHWGPPRNPPESPKSLDFNRGKRIQTDPVGGVPPGGPSCAITASAKMSYAVLLNLFRSTISTMVPFCISRLHHAQCLKHRDGNL